MKATLIKILAVPALCLFASAAARADLLVLTGILTSKQVVDGGGSTSNATGFAALTIDTTLETLALDFSWENLSGPADRAHLHDAPAGVSRQDPPNNRFFDEVINDADRTVVPCPWATSVYPDCVPATGSLHFTDAYSNFGDTDPSCDPLMNLCSFGQFEDMALADGFYLDIHTQLFPQGEIRGQLLVATPEPAALWLLLTFLGLLALGRYRQRGARPSTLVTSKLQHAPESGSHAKAPCKAASAPAHPLFASCPPAVIVS
jgi:hypothetical protein